MARKVIKNFETGEITAREASPEELVEAQANAIANAWSDLRKERDARLDASDWRITKEVEQAARDGLGLQIPLVWLDYRQALRDLPANTLDPFNPVWPQEP